ncbi:MAG TPA: FKBP-type peptidyl-prolyl cis-trans isomerase [Agromyces sp.]
MRSSLALIATAGLVAVALSGCAPAPTPQASPGRSSDLVTVRGDFGEAPRVEFPTPLAPQETQCTEVIAGDGELLADGQQALVGLAVYNGRTGEDIELAGFGDEEPVPVVAGRAGLPGIAKGLSCASEGSRVAVVVPPADGFGEQGNPSLGIEPGDSLVMVIDVRDAFLTRANGAVRLSRDGFPAVVLAPDGRPGITVPKTEAPTTETAQVEVLKAGNGPVVESGDRVVVHYTGVTWDDNKVFDSSWENGVPATFVVSDGDDSEVIPGFADAVIGQKVGSQVGVIVPPSEGYGDQQSGRIPPGSTLFFVIDILGVV